MKFSTTLLQAGKTATGIVVPPSVVEALGAGKKPPVVVTINGYSYRSTIAVMGGDFMIPVSAEHRGNAGVSGGDEIEVTVTLDTEPRVVVVPDDFALALSGQAAAKEFFDKLSYSHQRQHVLAIEDAKTPETRAKRIDKALAMLREGKK
jgi:hypothetical protein